MVAFSIEICSVNGETIFEENCITDFSIYMPKWRICVQEIISFWNFDQILLNSLFD